MQLDATKFIKGLGNDALLVFFEIVGVIIMMWNSIIGSIFILVSIAVNYIMKVMKERVEHSDNDIGSIIKSVFKNDFKAIIYAIDDAIVLLLSFIYMICVVSGAFAGKWGIPDIGKMAGFLIFIAIMAMIVPCFDMAFDFIPKESRVKLVTSTQQNVQGINVNNGQGVEVNNPMFVNNMQNQQMAQGVNKGVYNQPMGEVNNVYNQQQGVNDVYNQTQGMSNQPQGMNNQPQGVNDVYNQPQNVSGVGNQNNGDVDLFSYDDEK